MNKKICTLGIATLMFLTSMVSCGHNEVTSSSSLDTPSEVTSTNESSTTSESIKDELTLAKEKALEVLEREFLTYNESDYLPRDWKDLIKAYNDGKTSINNASSIVDINRAKNLSLSTMTLTPTSGEANIQTIFSGMHTGYNINPLNEEGSKISITHNEKLGPWGTFLSNCGYQMDGSLYVVNKLEIKENENTFKFSVKNTGTNEIKFSMNLTTLLNTNEPVASSGIVKVKNGETITKELSFTTKPEVIFFFFDSCYNEGENISSQGSIEFFDYSFCKKEKIPTASTWINDTGIYTIKDKEGTLANITYTDIGASIYNRISHDILNPRSNEFARLSFRNNGKEAVRLKIHVGYWGDLDNDGTYTWVGLLNNYTYDNNGTLAYGEGYELSLPADGQIHTMDTIFDNDELLKSIYGDKYERIIRQVFIEVDCTYWEQDKVGRTYSGDIDIVNLEMLEMGE